MDPNENRPFDVKLLLAFALMFVIVMVYTMYMQPPPRKETPEPTPEVDQTSDTLAPIPRPTDEAQFVTESPRIGLPDTTLAIDTILIETPLFTAHLSTLGADLIDYQLKEYHYITESSDDGPISLIPARSESTLRFEFWGEPLKMWQRGFTTDVERVVLTDAGDSSVVTFAWMCTEGYAIEKTYIFYADRHSFDVILSIPADLPIPLEREYTFGWNAGIEPTESNMKEDVDNLAAVAMLGQDIEEVKKIADEERPKRFGGTVRWAGVRSKYFLNVVIPRTAEPDEFIADRRFGMVTGEDDQYKIPYFSSRFAVRVSPGEVINHRFTVYMGPLDYFIIKEYGLGLEGLLHLGFRYVVRPFAIFVLWAFSQLYGFIPNYGFVIILFGFLVKALFHPLTKKSMASMQRMKDLSPKLQKLREKFKNDSQRMNRETMKLYKEAGFNPISGCLPLLAQMPVFFALYQVLRSSIQMRGAEFIFHITDLSQKDSLYILPVIMTLSFFWQQKMTSTDPKQKALVYIMPLVFGFLFATSPAGLTLYWTIYNVFSVVEQYMIKSKKKKEG